MSAKRGACGETWKFVVTVLVAVSLSVWAVSGTQDDIKTSGQKFPVYNNNVWVLGEEENYTDSYSFLSTGCDTTNVAALTTDHMHVDYYTTVENLRMIRFNLLLPADFVAIRMISEEQQDEVFVAVHKGHMTVNRFGNYTMFPIPVAESSSLFIVGNLACVVPAASEVSNRSQNGIGDGPTSQSDSYSTPDHTHILCVNVVKGTYTTCPDKVLPGSHGYADVPRGLVLVTDPTKRTVQTFKLDNDCVSLVSIAISNDGNGNYGDNHRGNDNYGDHLWFSYKGSRVFLDDGLTLNTDGLSPAGTLGGVGVGTWTYSWVSQLYRTELLNRGHQRTLNPSAHKTSDKSNLNSDLSNGKGKDDRPIMALREDVMDVVFYYTWPQLDSNGTEAIPVPTGYTMVRPISLHFCQPDFAYAMVTYKHTKSGGLRTGVAYLKHDWSN